MLCEQSLQYLEYLACPFFVIVIPFCFFGIFLDPLSRNIYPTPTHYSCCGGEVLLSFFFKCLRGLSVESSMSQHVLNDNRDQ